MLKTIIRCTFILTLLAAGLAAAEPKVAHPKQINLVYDVTRNGQPFATVTESYKQSGDQYHIVSVTKGIGVYALLGERKLTSDGIVTAEGLKPSHFELRQGDNAKKWLATDFDWANNKLNMTIKDAVETTPLLVGAQDLVSYLYQFMFESLAKNNQADIVINVATGKKLKPYTFKVATHGETLTLVAGSFKSTQLSSVQDANKENSDANRDDRQIWLANEQYNLPLRLIMHDDKGGVIEQNLKSLQFE